MSIDLDMEALLAPLGGEEPCGPNLEYDADFMALEDAMRVDPGQEFGETAGGERITIEGAGIDWPAVRKGAESLLQRTRDLRVAVNLTRALLHTEGFEGLPTGLRLVADLLEQHWEHVHPQLDAEDNDDPTMRVNALAPLVANDAIVDDLRSSWLMRSRGAGVLTVRAVEIARGRLPPPDGEAALSESQLLGMLAEAVQQNPGLPQAVAESMQAVKAISACLQERVGASRAIDFKPLESILQECRAALGQIVPAADEGNAIGMVAGAPGAASQLDARVPAAAKSGEIRSRKDVIAALDQLVQYLQTTEPTNPAQMLLRRAQRVMNMSFLEAINELAPDALHQAELMLGEQLKNSEG